VDNRLVIVGGAIELPATTTAPSASASPAPGLQEQLASAGRITFETASSALTPEGSATVDLVASLLAGAPGVRVEVHGHTDSDGESVFNEQLSQERSEAVVEALRIRGVDPGRLSAIGFGESDPIEPNVTAEGRATNRRIEFVVVS
jgi:OOP family OmpA-OmpF porin